MVKGMTADNLSTLIAPEVEELKRSVARLQSFIDEAPFAVCTTDLKGNITYINKGFEEGSGYSKEEVVGKNGFTLDMVSPETMKYFAKRLKARLMGKPPKRWETLFRCKDGRQLWVEIQGTLIKERGIPVGFQIVATNITERKKAEEALQTEKNKLQSVVDALEYGLTIQDRDYNILYQNEIGKGYFGDHLGEKCYRIYGGSEKICDGCPVEKAFKDGKSHTGERRQVMSSGEVTHWENTASPVKDAQGNIVACLEINRDITERKQAAQALADEVTRRRILIDQSRDGIVVLDQDGKVYEANQRFAEMLGYSGEEVRQLSVFDWEYLFPREQVLEMIRTVDEAGDHFETQHRRKDGSTYNVEISTNAATFAGQKLIFCVCRDITERKRIEGELRESQEALQKMFESVTDGISVINLKGVITEANQRLVEMHGFGSKDKLVGKSAFDLVAPRDHKKIANNMRKALKEGTITGAEYTLLRADGSEFPGELSTSVLKDASGKMIGHITIARDITQRKQMVKLFQTVTNSSPVGIYIIQDKKFQLANPQFQKLTGYTEDELVGMDSLALVLPEDRDMVREKAIKMLKGERSSPYQFRVINKSGETRWVMETVTSIQYRGRRAILGNYMDITERRQAEEALKESEEFRSSLLANSPNPIGVINADSSIRYVNPALEKLTGFSAAELIGQKAPYPYWTEETLKRTIMSFRKAMRQGDQKSEELFKKKNGERFWVKITSTPVMNDGEFKYLLTNWVDITKRKQVEEALRQSEKKYKNLAEATSDMIWEADEKGYFTFVGPRIKDLLGYEANEVIGKIRTLDLVPKAEAQEWLKRFKKISAKRGPFFGFEITHLHKDGNPVLFEISGIPTFDGDGNFKGYVGINKNITERKQAEEELRESQRFSFSLLENAPNPIFVTNPDTSVRYVNPAFEKLTGFSLAEIAGKKAPYPWWPQERRKEMTATFKNSMVTGGKRSERLFQKKNGERFWVALNSVPIMHEGKLIYFLINWVDITERKRMEEQLMLTDRLASIGELASGIAHELNNPLTSVIGFSQLLLEENIPDNLKEDLGTIYSEAQRASSIVKNLLTFARKHAPMRQLSQVNAIIEDVLKLRAYEQKVTNIEIDKKFANNLPEIMVDYFQMQQVFLNLIVNAETAMLEANGKGKLVITTSRHNNTVKVTIADNGPGIAKENLSRVFDPFFTTKEVGKGTGLGLSICHGIVTGHGGRIYAESETGKGATLVVELPVNGHSEARRNRHDKT